MARVTVEDCLEHEENRFALVVPGQRGRAHLAHRRPNAGALVKSSNRPAVTALREIAAAKVHFDRPSHGAVLEYIEAVHKREFGE